MANTSEKAEAVRQFILTIFDDDYGRSAARQGIPIDLAINPADASPGAEVARFAYQDELKCLRGGGIQISKPMSDALGS